MYSHLNFMCLFSSQGLPFLPLSNSENSRFVASVPSGSTKFQAWNSSRKECPTWSRCQGPRSQCHLSQKATCLHGKYVFSNHPSSFIHSFYFLPDPKSYLRIILLSISSRGFILPCVRFINLLSHSVTCLELQGHATKNQDLLLASGTISLKGSDGLNAVDDDVMAAVSFL